MCMTYNAMCTSHAAFKDHIASHSHKNRAENAARAFECKLCDKTFKNHKTQGIGLKSRAHAKKVAKL